MAEQERVRGRTAEEAAVGNHFLTITEGKENLRKLGELTLWEGAQDIVFDRA